MAMFTLLLLLMVCVSHTCCKVDPQMLFTIMSKLESLNSGNLTASDKSKSMSFVDPVAFMTFCEMANYQGYKCEEYLYKVVTEDGYLLTLHRVTGKMGSSHTNSTRLPVFIQHGLLADSTSWIVNLPNQSLPYALVDAGYDVWLGNSRGNTYSRAHQTLKVDSDAFWAWSWDQMAEYDLPASIDFVLKHTGHEKLYYIGHSQGTLIAFAHLATTYTNKIAEMIALAPVFKLDHIISPLQYLAPYSGDIEDFLELFGIRDVLPNGWFTRALADDICNIADVTQEVCGDALMFMAGFDSSQFNQSRIAVYINHIPAGTSIRNFLHFKQMFTSKEVRKYDYGSIFENLFHYGTTVPPAYDIRKISGTPVTLYWAENDWLADATDVKYIMAHLKTLKASHYIQEWEHLDFLWALNTKYILYEPIVKQLNSLGN